MLDDFLTISKIRKKFDSLVIKLFGKNVNPNLITLIGGIIGIISGILIPFSRFKNSISIEIIVLTISAILMWISFLFDLADGTLARLHTPTKFGGILDVFMDRCVEISIILGNVFTNLSQLAIPGLFSLASIIVCITIFLLVAEAVDEEKLHETSKSFYYMKGIMERSETVILLFFITILPYFRLYLLWTLAVLVFLTAIQRVYIAYKIFYRNVQ